MQNDELKAISLRLPRGLLGQIDQAAAIVHMDRSTWIRTACVAQLSGTEPSKDTTLLEDIQVVDERARAVIKDILKRLDALERQSGIKDPFS